MDEPPPLTPEEILWVRKTKTGQEAIGFVLGWVKRIGLWVGTVVGALAAIWSFHPWSRGGGP